MLAAMLAFQAERFVPMSLVRFGLSVPKTLIEAFDRHIRRKGYRTRSEAGRDLV